MKPLFVARHMHPSGSPLSHASSLISLAREPNWIRLRSRSPFSGYWKLDRSSIRRHMQDVGCLSSSAFRFSRPVGVSVAFRQAIAASTKLRASGLRSCLRLCDRAAGFLVKVPCSYWEAWPERSLVFQSPWTPGNAGVRDSGLDSVPTAIP